MWGVRVKSIELDPRAAPRKTLREEIGTAQKLMPTDRL